MIPLWLKLRFSWVFVCGLAALGMGVNVKDHSRVHPWYDHQYYDYYYHYISNSMFYIYIYIEREREIDIDIYIFLLGGWLGIESSIPGCNSMIYIYIYIYVYRDPSDSRRGPLLDAPKSGSRATGHISLLLLLLLTLLSSWSLVLSLLVVCYW